MKEEQKLDIQSKRKLLKKVFDGMIPTDVDLTELLDVREHIYFDWFCEEFQSVYDVSDEELEQNFPRIRSLLISLIWKIIMFDDNLNGSSIQMEC